MYFQCSSTGALEICICISGWLRAGQEASSIWSGNGCTRVNDPPVDVFYLQWESELLTRLGNSIESMISTKISRVLISYWLQNTIASAIVLPLFVVNHINNIDNAWATTKEKVKIAGEVLAQALMDRNAVGYRPVTLIGYSMGARIIFYCLQTLFQANAFCCVQDVVLVGAPLSIRHSFSRTLQWSQARAVVSGRFINGYSTSDWILAFLYRFMEWGISVAGLRPVSLPGIEDIDITSVVATHNEYPLKMHEILTYMNVYK